MVLKIATMLERINEGYTANTNFLCIKKCKNLCCKTRLTWIVPHRHGVAFLRTPKLILIVDKKIWWSDLRYWVYIRKFVYCRTFQLEATCHETRCKIRLCLAYLNFNHSLSWLQEKNGFGADDGWHYGGNLLLISYLKAS